MVYPDSFKVPYNFDGLDVGEIYEIKIKNMFDPSKLWIIVNFSELYLFTKYLRQYYSKNENRIKVPIFKLKKYLLCIIERNSDYYRAVILPIFLPEGDKVRVFLIDEGTFINVNVNNIFYLLQKHSDVPRFALRACLISIAPPDSNESVVWTTAEYKFLSELIADHLLYAKIEGINKSNKILYVDIFRKEKYNSITAQSVTAEMLQANMASPASATPKIIEQITKYHPITNYPYLYPTIEAIEEGNVPSSLWELILVKESVPKDLLLSAYYQYKDINAHV